MQLSKLLQIGTNNRTYVTLRPRLAHRGCSRDHRGDCKQVIVGFVVNRDGFRKAHEIFDGNRSDVTTIDDMLEVLFRRVKNKGGTVVVDRGLASAENLEIIKSKGLHYVVAARQEERNKWLDEFESEGNWREVERAPSPTNPSQKKISIKVMKKEHDGEMFILCLSKERIAKDRAIRESQEKKFLSDLGNLARSIEKKQLVDPKKIYEAIGRLKERYPRVARYYEISFDKQRALIWQENADKKETVRKLDGSYILRTDRNDFSAEDTWLMYSLLIRAEDAFRTMESPLAEHPIFHQLKERTQTHNP